MTKIRKMYTKFENYMAERIKNELSHAIYENMYNQNEIEEIVDYYIQIDYKLTVKDDMATVELEEAPTEESKFEDYMYSKKLTLVKLDNASTTANYRIQETDTTEKKQVEEKMITVWLTTLPDDHENWDWDGSVLSLMDKDMDVLATYSRAQLIEEIKKFPKD